MLHFWSDNYLGGWVERIIYIMTQQHSEKYNSTVRPCITKDRKGKKDRQIDGNT